VYQGFGEAVARPLGMEDYRVGDGIRFREPSRSKHPAHAFRLSARDLARVGELYLRGGRRGGRELLPPGWVDSVSARHTEWENGSGYGWLWWVNPTRGPYYRSRPTLDGLDAVAAIGAGGELLLVLPREELVIVHLVDREHERDLPEDAALAVADLIASARPGSVMPVSRAAAGPLAARPFTGRSPAPARPRLAPPTAEDLETLPGLYTAGPDVEIRVTAYDGGLFALHSRLGEIELLREGADAFLAVGGRIRVRFERDGAGKVKGMVAETPGGPLAATRR
jgi:hypothetical protein